MSALKATCSEETEFVTASLHTHERFALAMRVAKVSCERGEFLCVVKSISAARAEVRFFHQAPASEVLQLEMANGFRSQMQLAWREGDQAGYCFDSPIEISECLDNPGRHGRPEIRVQLDLPCEIAVGEETDTATLLDLSQSGACIFSVANLSERQMLRMGIDGREMRIGHVQWRKGEQYGLIFQQSLGLVELAKIAHEAGPPSDLPSSAVQISGTDLPLAQCA